MATFVGDTNLLSGRVSGTGGGHATVSVPTLGRDVPAPAGDARVGAAARLSIRPENIRIADPASPWRMDAVVLDIVYAGAAHRYTVEAGEARLLVSAPASPGTAPFAPGQRIALTWAAADVALLAASAP